MSEFEFQSPWILLLALVVPVGLAIWWRGTRKAANRARQLSRVPAASPPYLAAILFSLAAFAAIAAAAQPRWGTHTSRIPRSGADLVVVIDVSKSMDARDVAPSRLEAAKSSVDNVLNRLGGDRFGLVVFGGDARVRFPLTTDFAAARQVVDGLETGTVFVDGGTSAGLGLQQALSVLGDEPDTGKVILLLTDGDDLGSDPASTAERIRQSGADLLIAGVGTTQGATIPVFDLETKTEHTKLDADGVPIVTSLQEPFLRALAVASGGRYLGSDLSIVAGAVDGRLRALERSRIDERPTVLPVERYQYFAAAALVLLVLGALAERFARFAAKAPLVLAALALLISGCATESYKANEAGRDAMARGDFDAAVEKFTEAQVNRPDDPEISLNLAAAYAAAGQQNEAIAAARRAIPSNDPEVRARAYSTIGHQQFDLERLPESLDAFRRALLDNPKDDDIRHDYEVVLRLLFPSVPATPSPTPTPTPTGQTGETPGAGASPSTAASGTPDEGGTGQGTPVPGQGSGTPTPGAGSGSATAEPGTPGNLDQINDQIATIDSTITRLLQESGETPTPQQALEILRLLAERADLASKRDSLQGGGGPRDY
ncbi:MAG: VWA domain-containing protein [Dehalococcoidia bacterium]